MNNKISSLHYLLQLVSPIGISAAAFSFPVLTADEDNFKAANSFLLQ